MKGSRSGILMVLASMALVPAACTQSVVGPAGAGSTQDFFHFRRTPTPTRTATALSTPTATRTATSLPSPTPSSTPTTAVPSPSPTNTVPTLSPTVAATCNPVAALGNAFAGSATFNPTGSQEIVLAQPEMATASGNLSQVFLNVQAPPLFLDGGMVGVYSDDSGQPGTLLAHSALFTSLSKGVNGFAVPATAITQGTRYWLVLYAAYPNGGALLMGDAPAPGPLVQYNSGGLLNVLPNSLSGLTRFFEYNAALDMEGDICQ